ncbi:MAG TPA: DUF3800 domain-containing protein [Polyangiaceae bacterium]
MFLLYTDESGKSGLRDPRQPWHVLGGVVVHDQRWQAVEVDLMARIDALLPPPRPPKWELHMTDIWNGKRFFAGTPRAIREQLVVAVLDVIEAHNLTLFMMVVDKAAHLARYISPEQPEFLTYKFMIERFDHFLDQRQDKVGMIVADEAKGQEETIREAHARYRSGGTGWQSIQHLVETAFFVPSHYSCMLQIADVAAWWCNRSLRLSGRNIWAPGVSPEWDRLRERLPVNPANGQIVGLKIFP